MQAAKANPPVSIQLSHSFGFEATRRGNLFYLEKNVIVYIAGNFVHFFHLVTGKQTSFKGTQQGIGAIVVHPSGEYLAIGECGHRPNIYIYKYPSFELYKTLHFGTECAFTALAFNKDGDRLASVGSHPDYMLTVWSWEEARILLKSKAFSQEVFKVSFSPLFPGILTSSGTGHIKFWKMAQTFTGLKLKGELGKFGNIDLSDVVGYVELPSGHVLCGTESGTMLLWDGNLIKAEFERDSEHACHKGMIEVVRHERDQGLLITAGHDGCIRWWNDRDVDIPDIMEHRVAVQPRAEISIGSSSSIREMVKARDHWLVQDAASLVKLFYSNHRTLNVMQYPAGPPNAVRFLPDAHGELAPGRYIATACEDGSVAVYDAVDRRLLAIRRFNAPALCLAWAPPSATTSELGPLLACGFADGVLRVLALDPTITHPSRPAVPVTPTSASIPAEPLPGCARMGLRLCDAFKPHAGPLTSLSYSPGSPLLATGSADSTLFFFRAAGGATLPVGFVRWELADVAGLPTAPPTAAPTAAPSAASSPRPEGDEERPGTATPTLAPSLVPTETIAATEVPTSQSNTALRVFDEVQSGDPRESPLRIVSLHWADAGHSLLAASRGGLLIQVDAPPAEAAPVETETYLLHDLTPHVSLFTHTAFLRTVLTYEAELTQEVARAEEEAKKAKAGGATAPVVAGGEAEAEEDEMALMGGAIPTGKKKKKEEEEPEETEEEAMRRRAMELVMMDPNVPPPEEGEEGDEGSDSEDTESVALSVASSAPGRRKEKDISPPETEPDPGQRYPDQRRPHVLGAFYLPPQLAGGQDRVCIVAMAGARAAGIYCCRPGSGHPACMYRVPGLISFAYTADYAFLLAGRLDGSVTVIARSDLPTLPGKLAAVRPGQSVPPPPSAVPGGPHQLTPVASPSPTPDGGLLYSEPPPFIAPLAPLLTEHLHTAPTLGLEQTTGGLRWIDTCGAHLATAGFDGNVFLLRLDAPPAECAQHGPAIPVAQVDEVAFAKLPETLSLAPSPRLEELVAPDRAEGEASHPSAIAGLQATLPRLPSQPASDDLEPEDDEDDEDKRPTYVEAPVAEPLVPEPEPTDPTEDITDPAQCSIEDARVKDEDGRQRDDAEEKQEARREQVTELRTEFEALQDENRRAHPKAQLTESELNIDPEIRTLLASEMNDRVASTREELAWEAEYSQVALDRAKDAFLGQLEVERVVVHSFRTGRHVSTFRVSRLPRKIRDALARLQGLLDSTGPDDSEPIEEDALEATTTMATATTTTTTTATATTTTTTVPAPTEAASVSPTPPTDEAARSEVTSVAGESGDTPTPIGTPALTPSLMDSLGAPPDTAEPEPEPAQAPRARTLRRGKRGGRTAPVQSKQEARRLRVAERERQWLLFRGNRPSTAKPADAMDLAAIEEAKTNMGFHILKTDPNYRVPEEERVNAEKKYSEMVFLHRAIYNLKNNFNKFVFALRDLKRRTIRELKRQSNRLLAISTRLGEPHEIFCPEIAVGEYPERRFKVTDAEIRAHRTHALKEKLRLAREAKERESGGFGGLSAGDGADTLSEADLRWINAGLQTDELQWSATVNEGPTRPDTAEGRPATAEGATLLGLPRPAARPASAMAPSHEPLPGTPAASWAWRNRVLGLGTAPSAVPQDTWLAPPGMLAQGEAAQSTALASSTTAVDTSTDSRDAPLTALDQRRLKLVQAVIPSGLERSDQAAHKIRLQAEVHRIAQHMDSLVDVFDTALEDLRIQKFALEADLKMAEMRVITNFEELRLLNDFEKRDNDLSVELNQKRADKNEYRSQYDAVRRKLDEQTRLVKRLKDKEAEYHERFRRLVEKSNHADILGRIFKRKRPKQREQQEEEETHSIDEDASLSDISSDEEADEGEPVSDECPPGCDGQLHADVLALREKRLETEDALQRHSVALETLGKESGTIEKRSQTVRAQLEQTERKINEFQNQKQMELNKIEVAIPMRTEQICYLRSDGTPFAHPADQAPGDGSLALPIEGPLPYLPHDRTECVVITTELLARLQRRQTDLVDERQERLNDHKRLKNQCAKMDHEIRAKMEELEKVRQDVTDVQIMMFGKPLHPKRIEALFAMTENKVAERIQRNIQTEEAQLRAEESRLEEAINELKAELTEATHTNTERLQRLGDLLEAQQQMERSLSAGVTRVVAEFNLGEAAQLRDDRQGLREEVQARAAEIEALRTEIGILRHKGGFVYTPIQQSE